MTVGRPPANPSSFFRLNEEIALELSRLEREGQLARLQELLRDAGVELLVSSVRAAEGLEELIGILRAPADDEAALPVRRDLPPSSSEGSEGCGCAPAEAAAARSPRGGWDHEGVLAARSRFTVVYRDGTAGEVYMPDHVCPTCWNEAGNKIDACARVCGACGFTW